MPEPEKLGPCAEVKRLYESHIGFWRSKREARAELKRFLNGDRHQDDHGEFNRDRRLTQVIGQEVMDTHRHITAVTTAKPWSIEARPIDDIDDPEAAEVEVALIEGELSNPWKGFKTHEEIAIQDCRETRIGIVWMDWHPEIGDYGEILYHRDDADRYMWDECYFDPHDPLCGWLIRECEMDIDEARQKYKAPWLEPDGGTTSPSGPRGMRADQPLQQSGRGHDAPKSANPRIVTLWQCWYKNDQKYMKKKPDPALPKEQWYMSCAAECGYRSDPQQQLQNTGQLEGDLPEMSDSQLDPTTGEVTGGCPQCGGTLERIDERSDEEMASQTQARGKRLVIVAPFSPAPDPEKPVYDGVWPIPTARSFPIYVITAYPSADPVPKCDTDYMWPQQSAQDQLDTAALQQVLEHRNIYIWPGAGIEDVNRERYEARDDQTNHAFRDATKAEFGALTVDVLNPSGVDPNFGMVRSIINDNLTRYTGKSDIGLNSEVDKGQSGVALAQRNQVGEIPGAHFRRRRSQSLSKFAGVNSDYIHATYTPARLNRLGMNGVDIVTRIWGADLPNFDLVIEDAPDNDGLDEQRAKTVEVIKQAISDAVTLGVDPVEYIEIVAEPLHLSRSIVRKMQKLVAPIAQKMQMEQQMQQAMEMEAAMGGGPAGKQGAPSGPPSPQPQANGNGGGAVPLPSAA